KSKLVYGGGIGLSFGGMTNVMLAPVVGYRVLDRVAAGVGIGYQFVQVRNGWQLTDPVSGAVRYYDYKSNNFFPSAWVRYKPLDWLFAHAEYQHNFVSTKKPYLNGKGGVDSRNENYNVPCVLVGAGIRQGLSDFASLNILAFYDLLQDPNSPYRNTGSGLPIDFRIDFLIGF